MLFVPTYYDRHQEWVFPGWEDPSLFGNSNPVSIEYCSGNGLWAIEKAKQYPERNWVAVEIQFERVRKIWSKCQNEKLSNLLIVCGEALTFTRYYLPASCVQEMYVNFPDPWPKEKHAKNRLLQPAFVEEVARIIRPGGGATLVTDDPDYCEQMSRVMRENLNWKPSFPEPYYVTDWTDYGRSYFDTLWREKGRTIRYLHLTRQES